MGQSESIRGNSKQFEDSIISHLLNKIFLSACGTPKSYGKLIFIIIVTANKNNERMADSKKNIKLLA